MTSELTDLLGHQIAARHSPGALVHVEPAGQVLARHAAGRIQPDTAAAMQFGVRFCIASLTKPVVTVAALKLVDEGRPATPGRASASAWGWRCATTGARRRCPAAPAS